VANQPRDPEAERFIADKLRQQPYAPYAMAQAIFVQEQALANLQAENQRLRAELEELSRQPRQGGFLSGLFGGGTRPPGPAYNAPPARQASPWGDPNQAAMQPPPYGYQGGGMMGGGGPWGGGMMQPRGGGFLQGALSTAAGVAGGMMIANALSHAFGGEHAAAAGHSALAGLDQGSSPPDTGTDYAGITDSLYDSPQGQADDVGDFDGGDGGDGGDWT
jgi:hypothetical protein